MNVKTVLSNVAGALLVLASLVVFALGHAQPAAAFDTCEVGESNCCACNEGGSCIEVEHQGVASCTFEFCSETNCWPGQGGN